MIFSKEKIFITLYTEFGLWKPNWNICNVEE